MLRTADRAIAVVVAKGASTRIPHKNLQVVAGRPLLHYVLDHVRDMELPVDRAVMTECDAVAAVCQEFRVLREIAAGDPPICRRLAWAIGELERATGVLYRHVLLINADTPVRPAGLFDDALRMARETGADIVQSVMPTPLHFHPYRQYLQRLPGDLQPLLSGVDNEALSQTYPTVYTINGGVTVMARQALANAGYMGTRHPSLHVRPIVCPVEQLVEIDTPDDLESFRRSMEHAGAA